MTKKTKKQPKKQEKKPSKEGVLTKDEFFKALDKVISVVKPKSPAKGKSKTSEHRPEGVEIIDSLWKATAGAWAQSQGKGFFCSENY